MRSAGWWIPGLVVLGSMVSMVAPGCGGDKPAPAPSAERRGAPPPPPAASSGKPVSCTRSAIDDEPTKAFFPSKSAGFCLDPADGGKAMGKDSKQPLEGMCDLFDGECKVYETFGVERVVQLRYVAEKGGAATIDVIASRFASPGGAFGMFTKRVVGDGDPKDPATPKALDAGGAAGLGAGNAYLWRGAWLVEVTYNDDRATPAELEKAGNEALPTLVRSIGDAIVGDKTPPADVALLPAAARVPMGVRFVPDELLPFAKGFGPGAFGYHDEAGKRYRVLAARRASEADAKASIAALGKVEGASPETGLGDEAVRLVRKEGAIEWELVVARKGAIVLGLTDEPRALRGGMPAAEREALVLSKDDKAKKLEGLLGEAR